ncbi:MAG: hypothetical protein HN353_08685 [Bdellovibrionales bacterium]|jgi:hypothetical protein|nr:hypothetical protein [Bdellovibrionales bacterium]MBT3526897.1 hypothetical protein [Bdellovibrionales bacterium]MBT7767238.1 hypothetical protein [Bdellovibrionales bacterium]
MKTVDAMNEFLSNARKLAVSQKNRDRLVEVSSRAGITLSHKLELTSDISDQQIEKLITELSDLAIIKIAAKRIFRKHGYHF